MSDPRSPSSNERRVLARGAVGVDPRAAIAKLREFMLPDPSLYVAELVRVAVELGASKIVVDNTARDFMLACECKSAPPSPELLVRLFEQLFASDQRVLRLLAIATNTALGLGPNFVDVYTGSERRESQVARVRFVPTPPGEEPTVDGALEWVDPPEGFSERSLRVHVRERFGASVLREWFAEPTESRVLRTRCLLVPAEIVRAVDGAPVDRGPPPPALVRVSFGEKLHGELALVRAFEHEMDVIDFYERGVLLSRESLLAGETPANVRAYIDEPSLPTNVSRSAVDRSGSLGRQLARALDDALGRLVKAAVASLAGPHGADIAAALRSLIFRRLGSDWVSVARKPELSRENLFLRPALDAPLVPMASGTPRSLAALAADDPSALKLFRGDKLPPSTLAPWLRDVVHATDPTVTALVEALELADASVALAQAEESHARYRRFLAHKPRDPRVSSSANTELVRALLGDSKREGHEGVPSIIVGGDPSIRGEMVIHRASGSDRPMELTLFVEGRPLPPSVEWASPLGVQVAVQHERLGARADFLGPERSAEYNQLVANLDRAATEALWFAAQFLADPKALDGDERVHWMGPAAQRFDARDRAAVIEHALGRMLAKSSAKNAKMRAAELLAEVPALTRFPWFAPTRGAYVSLDAMVEHARRNDQVVLYVTNGATVEHASAPVYALTEAQRSLLATIASDLELVDYTRFAAKEEQSLRDLVSKDSAAGTSGPWLSLIEDNARAMVTIAQRNSNAIVLHRGQTVAQTSESGALGRGLLRIADGGFIPRASKEFSRAMLSEGARRLFDEGAFDLLRVMLRAIGGDREAARMLDVTLPWAPPKHVMAFLFVSAARLRALPPDERRGTLEPTSHAELARLCDELPLVAIRTARGLQSTSLSALRERAKRAPNGALLTVEHAPDDVDYDSAFEPIVVSRGEYEAALAVGIGAKLVSGDAQLAPRREARKSRLALEAFELQPTIEFQDLDEFKPLEQVLVQHDHYACAMGLRPTPGRARYQVIHRDRVAFSGELSGVDLQDCPVIFRVRFNDASKALVPTLDALTSAGNGTLLIACKRALRKLVEEVCKKANGTSDPGASARKLVAVYCAEAGRVDDNLRTRAGRAVLWRAVPAGLASAEQCTVHGRGRVLYVSRPFDGWISAPDGESDPVAVFIEPTPESPQEAKLEAQLVRTRTLNALEFLTTLAPRDASDELEQLQRARRLLRSAKENVALSGTAAHPALSARIESLDARLGVGELRVTTSGSPRLMAHVFFNGRLAKTTELRAPIPIDVAIEAPALSESQARFEPFPEALANRVLAMVKLVIVDAMKKHDALPAWAIGAQRWVLLSGAANTKALRQRPLFLDTMGEPMSLDDLDEQQSRFGHVAYSLDPMTTPQEPIDPRRRVLRVSELEARWIVGSRVPMDYTSALREEQSAHARRRMKPATHIVLRESAPAGTSPFVLSIAEHGFEGEVVLIPSRAEPVAKVHLWHQRKPLGETQVNVPWPALVAIDVGELTPNRSESGPVEDAAFHRTRSRIAELVRAAIDAQFNAPPSALGSVRTNAAGSPALRDGKTRAIGMLWLLADPLEPGIVDVREPGESTLRAHDTRSATQSQRVKTLPIGGQLWFNHGVAERVTIAHQVVELTRWAYRALLGQLVSAKGANLDVVHAHLAYAAAARVLDTDTLRKWAADRLLPDSCTTFAKLEAHLAEGKLLELCPEGDARSVQERFTVQRSAARWFTALEELALIQVGAAESATAAESKRSDARAEPAPIVAPAPESKRGAPPAPPAEPASKSKPKAKPREPTLDDHVLEMLRRHGVVERDLRGIKLSADRSMAVLARYDANSGYATLYTHGELAQTLLTHPDPGRARRAFALALLGELNRALQRITDADEARMMRAMLIECRGDPRLER